MSEYFWKSVDFLDRSINYPWCTGAVLVSIVILVMMLWVRRKPCREPSKPGSGSGSGSDTPGMQYVRESARTISAALHHMGNRDYLEGLEGAVRALVLAEVAQTVDDNTTRLTQALGVDFHEYLSYVGTVVTEARSRLERRLNLK